MWSRRGLAWICVWGFVLLGEARPFADWGFFAGGTSQWQYSQVGQLGSNGFFGRYGVDASSTPGDYSSFNSWVGNLQTETGHLVSGTNATYSDAIILAEPGLRNEWASVTGRYQIAPYVSGSAPGGFVAMSNAQLTTWNVSVRPLQAISISWGKRDLNFALGFQAAENARTSEHLMLSYNVPVPNLLAVLVRSGLLPRRALSWFNPEYWPRYQKEDKDTGAKPAEARYDPSYYTEPDDDVYGREVYDPETGQYSWENPFQSGLLKDAPGDFDKRSFGYGRLSPGSLNFSWGFNPWKLPSNPPTYYPAGSGSNSDENPWALLPVGVAYNLRDLSVARPIDLIATLGYTSNDLAAGIGGTYYSFFRGPELQAISAVRANTPTVETKSTEGWIFLNYDNGWLRLAAEADWYYRTVRYQRSQSGLFDVELTPGRAPGTTMPEIFVDGSGRNVFAPQYVESWRYMARIGVTSPVQSIPATLTLLYSYIPGPDRRHGIYIDRQPYISTGDTRAAAVFQDYSRLLGFRFGAGGNYYQDISDASVYAIKLDYHLAANLLMDLSCLYARRTSTSGYGMGYIRPTTTGTVDYNIRGTFLASAPSIPENDLGWEVKTGIVWKLLDNWTAGISLAYWQPGRWFNYACIDRSVPNWDIGGAVNSWGINPNRKIDPVLSTQMRFVAAF